MSNIARITALAAVLAVTSSATAQKPVQQADRVVKKAEETVERIANTRSQLQSTIDVYNTLMRGAGDSKKLYNDLRSAVDRTDDRRDDVRKKGEELEKEAYKFFEEWTASLAAIGTPELKQRAQERLNESRLAFNESMEAGRRAGAEFDVFMGGLRDQITYLGFDLNPDGIASLAEDAERLNADAVVLFANIDGVNATITEYAEALRHQ